MKERTKSMAEKMEKKKKNSIKNNKEDVKITIRNEEYVERTF
jgi:hypothetical protein